MHTHIHTRTYIHTQHTRTTQHRPSMHIPNTSDHYSCGVSMFALQVLDKPGTADLSTWVDFGALRQGAQVCQYLSMMHLIVSGNRHFSVPTRMACFTCDNKTLSEYERSFSSDGWKCAQESGAPVCVYGPVSQAAFLTQLGIRARLERLLQVSWYKSSSLWWSLTQFLCLEAKLP